MINLTRKIYQVLYGSSAARQIHQIETLDNYTFKSAIDELKKISYKEDEVSSESPIFILSAGWRSGSTLLQRIICSDNNIIMWGEPYDRCNVVQNLADSIRPFSTSWPNPKWWEHRQEKKLSESWIANLYSSPEFFYKANLNYLNSLFKLPSMSLGASRWGVKEVRWGFKEALFLSYIYPNAKFLLLSRRLEDAYLSYKSFSPYMNWYSRWPKMKVFTPYQFASHWRKLCSDFELLNKELDIFHLNYEDLTNGQVDFRKIEKHCEIVVDTSVLQKKVAGSGEKKIKRKKISTLEKICLRLGSRS